ncbi:2-phosphosulfolactate phosphatase [Peribacillus sp. SCS-155]|uniref:2-phosphosulfolactate phosphatase n=1 Tax=Peribacillus sedimenti TaxID=3115297 RepID=UPI0039067EF6
MKKIHLLVKKEDIDEEKMAEGDKIAVVFDVLLATTTIVSALEDGALEVIPVLSSKEALDVQQNQPDKQIIVAGELNAEPVDGLVYPSPLQLRRLVKGKTLVLTTTNGTVALRKSHKANKVYVSSLLNNLAVANKLAGEWQDETVVVVCSGNSGEISLEDIYGAGHFISCLLAENIAAEVELTDAAMAALAMFEGREDQAFEVLESSYVGRLFARHDAEEELEFASRKNIVSIVPMLTGEKTILTPVANKNF